MCYIIESIKHLALNKWSNVSPKANVCLAGIKQLHDILLELRFKPYLR